MSLSWRAVRASEAPSTSVGADTAMAMAAPARAREPWASHRRRARRRGASTRRWPCRPMCSRPERFRRSPRRRVLLDVGGHPFARLAPTHLPAHRRERDLRVGRYMRIAAEVARLFEPVRRPPEIAALLRVGVNAQRIGEPAVVARDRVDDPSISERLEARDSLVRPFLFERMHAVREELAASRLGRVGERGTANEAASNTMGAAPRRRPSLPHPMKAAATTGARPRGGRRSPGRGMHARGRCRARRRREKSGQRRTPRGDREGLGCGLGLDALALEHRRDGLTADAAHVDAHVRHGCRFEHANRRSVDGTPVVRLHRHRERALALFELRRAARSCALVRPRRCGARGAPRRPRWRTAPTEHRGVTPKRSTSSRYVSGARGPVLCERSWGMLARSFVPPSRPPRAGLTWTSRATARVVSYA